MSTLAPERFQTLPPGKGLYYHRGSGLFTPVNHNGANRQLVLPGDPEEPTDPGPITPGVFTHGSEIPSSSLAAEQVIGARGPLNTYTGPTDLYGTHHIENALIYEKNVRIRPGADVTLSNVRLIGPPGSTTYAIRINDGGGARLLMEDCTVVCRSVAGGATGGSMNIVGWGDVSLAIKRSVVRGGIDGLHFHGKGAPVWATGDPDIPWATLLVEDSWFGDNERLPGSHSDLFQMAGKSPNYIENYVWRRSRWAGYSLGAGEDALTNRADPATAGMASAGFMNSTGGASRIAIRKNMYEGGNWVVEGGNVLDPDTCWITDNLFAPRANFGAIRNANNWHNHNNRWAASGTLNNGTQVVGGELVAGSME